MRDVDVAASRRTYSVRCIKMGQSVARGPEVFWMSEWDTWYPLQHQIVLIQSPGVTAVIGTGPPPDLPSVHFELPEVEWANPSAPQYLRRDEHEYVVPALEANGLTPADISHVILTPLELYTTGAVNLFENAEICLSRRGWEHFHITHSHPHDRRWRSLSRETLIELVTDSWDRVRLLDLEDEIAPGLTTWWAGGHHRSTLVVEIETARGIVAVSDVFFYFENIESDRLLGLNENMYEVMAANRRVRART